MAATHSQLYRSGAVVWASGAAHTIGTNLRVGDQAGDNVSLNITSGAVTATTAFTIGNLAGSSGMLGVVGPAS